MAGCRVSQGRFYSRFFLLLSCFLVMACAEQDPVESVMPKPQSLSCTNKALPNEYIVQWKDGRISRVKYTSRDQLRENLVIPQVENIQRIEHDILFELKRVETNSGSFSARSGVFDNWGHANAGTSAAWQSGLRGKDVLVAVIDSGVEITHPLLQNRIFVNPGESGVNANNGVDDDGNGYVDDVNGWDFLQSRSKMNDEVGHGTHVAGIIAAEHSATEHTEDALLSVAPEAKILPLKFIGQFGGSLGGALEAMDYAGKMGAKIINASWGGEACSQILREKIVELGAQGVLFVAASGNSGNNLEFRPEYPAAFLASNQLTVGSITPFNGMSNFSNYSSKLVHIFAPGTDITSTYTAGSYQTMSGTSMATPFVAGVAALIRGAKPQLTPEEVIQILLKSVVKSQTYSNISQGRINLPKMLENL